MSPSVSSTHLVGELKDCPKMKAKTNSPGMRNGLEPFRLQTIKLGSLEKTKCCAGVPISKRIVELDGAKLCQIRTRSKLFEEQQNRAVRLYALLRAAFIDHDEFMIEGH